MLPLRRGRLKVADRPEPTIFEEVLGEVFSDRAQGYEHENIEDNSAVWSLVWIADPPHLTPGTILWNKESQDASSFARVIEGRRSAGRAQARR